MTIPTVFKGATLAVMLGGVFFFTQPAVAAQQLRVAGNFPVQHSVSKAMEVFKKEVEAGTKGEIVINLFPNMALGGASENIDQARSGTIFGTMLSVAYLSRVVPEFEAVSLPFLFTSRDDAYRVVDGKVGDILDARMAEKGFKGLGFGELGFRHVTNNVRPITQLADFKDLKIRLQPNEVHLNTFRALGANPVAMDISEVYSALQQGVLDGQENPYDSSATRRFNEVQKYLSNTGHFFDFMVFVANKRTFDKLSEANQAIVLKAADTAMQWQRKESASQDASWRDKLIQGGMQYTEISKDARAEMRKATQPVIEGVKKRIDPVVIDAVMAEVGQ